MQVGFSHPNLRSRVRFVGSDGNSGSYIERRGTVRTSTVYIYSSFKSTEMMSLFIERRWDYCDEGQTFCFITDNNDMPRVSICPLGRTDPPALFTCAACRAPRAPAPFRARYCRPASPRSLPLRRTCSLLPLVACAACPTEPRPMLVVLMAVVLAHRYWCWCWRRSRAAARAPAPTLTHGIDQP